MTKFIKQKDKQTQPTDTKTQIFCLVADKYNVDVDTLKPETPFIGTLGDSLDFVETIIATEREFQISFQDYESEQIHTIGDLVEYVAKKQKSAPQPVVQKKHLTFFQRIKIR